VCVQFQNAIYRYRLLALIAGINPLLGVLSGSVSLSGGYALSSVFGKVIENMGVNGAHSIALSLATFGIVAKFICFHKILELKCLQLHLLLKILLRWALLKKKCRVT